MNIQKQFCSKSVITSYRIEYYNSIEKVNLDHWEEVSKNQNIYLGHNYLSALEMGLSDFNFRYFLFYDTDNKIVGISYFQLLNITDQDVNFDALSNKMQGLLPLSFKKWLSSRILICGNAFATGENGFVFLDCVSKSDSIELIDKAIQHIVDQEEIANRSISISLIKELWPNELSQFTAFKSYKYHEVNIDVNMVLDIKPSWSSFDDYLKALNSKFRTKTKQVLKKSEQLEIIDFEIDTIQERLSEIDKLYHNMVNKSSFSFGRLNAKTLLELKDRLGESLYFKGYLLDNKLIGFATATTLNQTLDGNFIGIDHHYNKEFSVYQRILYDFIGYAIEKKMTSVRLGRTAEEIKSGVGALPIEMKFYAKHHNFFKNGILKPFISLLKPSQFNLRRPFKIDKMKKGA